MNNSCSDYIYHYSILHTFYHFLILTLEFIQQKWMPKLALQAIISQQITIEIISDANSRRIVFINRTKYISCKNGTMICYNKLDHPKFAFWKYTNSLAAHGINSINYASKMCVRILCRERKKTENTHIRSEWNSKCLSIWHNNWKQEKIAATKSNFHINSTEMAVTLID